MKSLVLHIGTTKTATTSIQQTLRKNRKRLARVGVLFAPQFTATFQRRFSKPAFYEAVRTFFSDPSAELQMMLISSEVLSILLAEKFLTSVALNGTDISATCLIYLRQPADHFISQYSTYVGTRLVPFDPEQMADFICQDPGDWSPEIKNYVVEKDGDFIVSPKFSFNPISRNRIRFLYSYGRLLDKIKENPLCGRLIVRAFDQTSFVGGNIFSDFQHQILPTHKNILKRVAPTKNVSSSRQMLDRMLEVNRSSSLTTDQRRELVRSLFWEDSHDSPLLKDDHVLCRRIEDRLFQAFGDDYQRLSGDYGAHLAPIACRMFG